MQERSADTPSDLPLEGWLLRLNPLGCFNDDCDHVDNYWHLPGDIVVATEDVSLTTLSGASLSPNPGGDRVKVALSDIVNYPLKYQMRTVDGRPVMTGTMTTPDYTTIDGSGLSAGMYFIALQDAEGRVVTLKWVKE